MTSTQDLLLADASKSLQVIITNSAGRHPLEQVFASWLVPDCMPLSSIRSNIDAAASASGAQRTYQQVAILGYAAELTMCDEIQLDALRKGLDVLSGKEPFVTGGTLMGFVTDGVALMGIARGVVSLKEQPLTDKIHQWIDRCRSASAGFAVVPFQRALIDAASAIFQPNHSVIRLDDPQCADVRVMLRSKGLLDVEPLMNSESDEIQLLTDLLHHDSVVTTPLAAIRLCALRYITSKSPTLDLSRITVKDLGNVLRRVEAGMRFWTWEDSPRTKRKGAEARKWHIDNEYHVQNLLWVILAPLFPDLKDEEYTPKVGALQPRADICIPSMQLIIEVKFWRSTTSSQDMIREIAQDNSLYLVKGSRYKKIIAFVWDDARRNHQHDVLIQGLLDLQDVIDAIVISRPGNLIEMLSPPDEKNTIDQLEDQT
ncbi:hypothetical protein [Gimesia sp.]|uniref:PD-(D/E)XK nuclease domain-containing protein n=1 Tax=Gimesia sp. TaxID=2024833 RepID=UPI003A8E2129